MNDARGQLTEDERARLDAGEHEQVAAALQARGRTDLAGWVREQIWDFDGALACYLEADMLMPALRMALASPKPAALDRAMDVLRRRASDTELMDRVIGELGRRGRHQVAAELMGLSHRDPSERADALVRAGDSVGAARVLAEAGRVREARERLLPLPDGPAHRDAHALAAELAWDLGDAEGAARHAQRALRDGSQSAELVQLLARALGSLGHDLAAQLVLEGKPIDPGGSSMPARYRITGLHPATIAGAAYVGLDRATLQEVEIHLLLAEQTELGVVDGSVRDMLERFAATAKAAAAIGHPAIRPIVRVDADAGLLVLPRAEGPDLRSLIHPPGMADATTRARALASFLIGGLAAGHRRGLVHGSLLPTQIVCDALGRPLLGPFGAHLLGGLAATRTAALEELLAVTAPEVRAGAPPTVASDVFAAGALLAALLCGNYVHDPSSPPQAARISSSELAIIVSMMAANPDERPDASTVLAALSVPVADMRELGTAGAVQAESSATSRIPTATHPREAGIEIVPATSWTDELLDELCASANPRLQPIIDRADRTLVLAPWPPGCKTVRDDSSAWRDQLPEHRLQSLPGSLHDAIESRLRPASVVMTAAGEWMLALDDLLTR